MLSLAEGGGGSAPQPQELERLNSGLVTLASLTGGRHRIQFSTFCVLAIGCRHSFLRSLSSHGVATILL